MPYVERPNVVTLRYNKTSSAPQHALPPLPETINFVYMHTPPQTILGTDDFSDLVLNGDVFVDKSLLIKEFLQPSNKVCLITRPRRWGKSLNMNMLKQFLSIEVDAAGQPLPEEKRTNRRLFVGGKVTLHTGQEKQLQPLKIAQEAAIVSEYQGQYPVISASLKDIRGSSLPKIASHARMAISEAFRAHKYLLNVQEIAQGDKEEFEAYLYKKTSDEALTDGFRFLSSLLSEHFQKPVYILIDEYDTPLYDAYLALKDQPEQFKEILKFFRLLMGSAFKTNPYLAKGLMTGILRIAKANILSDLNNVVEFSLLDKRFSPYYGFTQSEVDELLEQMPTTTPPEEIKRWYNGYTFGEEVVYNPWSIMCCLSNDGRLDSYWIDSGGTALVDEHMLDDKIQGEIQALVAGQTVESVVTRQIRFEDLNTHVGLYSLLLFNGYLNPDSKTTEMDVDICRLSIPNNEVRIIYRKRVLDWVARKLEISTDQYFGFVRLLAQGDIAEFEAELKTFLRECSSFHQTGPKTAELFYQGFMCCMLDLLRGYYTVESERESGAGRADALLIPKSSNRLHGLVIEYKVAPDKDSLAATAQAGLDQILSRGYATKLQSYPHVQTIQAVCMAFCGKEVSLKKALIPA